MIVNEMENNFEQVSLYKIIPVIRIDDVSKAIPLAKALKDGGLPVAEITFRTKEAEQAIAKITAEMPEMLVGAGTVLTIEQVNKAIHAGAKFIVSPGLNPKIVQYRRCSNLSVFASRIWVNYKHYIETQDAESLLRVSEHSLTAAGLLVCRMQQNIKLSTEEATQYLMKRLHDEYKPYTDKGSLAKKMNTFKLALKEVIADIKDKPVKTVSEMSESVKKLYHLEDVAIRVYVQLELQNEQKEVMEHQPITENCLKEISGIQLTM